jgi:uncharacterized protein YjbI with pentapeptide repeats
MESKTIGSKIANARKQGSLSQAQLAQQMFISPQAVGKWERGESIPDIVTMNRLANILGVDLNYFSESSQTLATHTQGTERVIDQQSASSSRVEGKKPGWDMSRENLLDIDFSGLKNLHREFSNSNIQRCLFLGSDMSGLLLKGNNVNSCDFSGSDISRSHIQASMLSRNIFKNCTLKESRFSKSFVEGCDITGADFTSVEFKSGGFGGNTIVNSVWRNASFVDAHLDDITFEGALENCHFENCGFTKVTFQNSTLTNTFFKNNKKLKRIQFINCMVDKITYAFLKNGKADLTGLTLLTP